MVRQTYQTSPTPSPVKPALLVTFYPLRVAIIASDFAEQQKLEALAEEIEDAVTLRRKEAVL